ncbi:13164_t:CDS:1, partial [Cetraspora pellucida]
AQIFHDLDGGFKPINFLFDDLPLPSNKLRDKAHVRMRNFFIDIMKSRRDTGKNSSTDLMHYLVTNCQYKSGRNLSDQEVAHIMIAMLMAGQHTSSTTSAWALLYLAQNPDLFNQLRQEQIKILGSLDAPLTYDSIKQLSSKKKRVVKKLLNVTNKEGKECKQSKSQPRPRQNYVRKQEKISWANAKNAKVNSCESCGDKSKDLETVGALELCSTCVPLFAPQMARAKAFPHDFKLNQKVE